MAPTNRVPRWYLTTPSRRVTGMDSAWLRGLTKVLRLPLALTTGLLSRFFISAPQEHLGFDVRSVESLVTSSTAQQSGFWQINLCLLSMTYIPVFAIRLLRREQF